MIPGGSIPGISGSGRATHSSKEKVNSSPSVLTSKGCKTLSPIGTPRSRWGTRDASRAVFPSRFLSEAAVTVTACSDRNRDGNTALLSSLAPQLLRGVPMEDRVLHPLDVKTEGEELTFSLELCVPLPEPEKPATEPPGVMENLHLGV